MGTASNVLYYIFSNFLKISIEHVLCAVYYVNSLVKMYVISVAINWVYFLYKELIHFYITIGLTLLMMGLYIPLKTVEERIIYDLAATCDN
jgi:hypothetical protein